MGPWVVTQGNKTTIFVTKSAPSRFNGALGCNPGKSWIVSNSVKEETMASMGPWVVTQGNAARVLATAPAIGASMGPWVVTQGNVEFGQRLQ
jgi:hypothetical protein